MSGPAAGRNRARNADSGSLTRLVRARRIGPGAVDAVRQDIERDSRLGIGYLGIGAVIVGAMMIVRGLVSFSWTWAVNDWRVLPGLGWLLVIAAFVAVVLLARRGRGVLPAWAFGGLLAADAVALALDYTAVALAAEPGVFMTTGIGVGATVLACVTFRPLTAIVVATVALTVVSLGALVWQSLVSPAGLGSGFGQVVLTVMPAFAGIVVVRAFGQLVERELDRTVVESTIDAPRFGLGLLASAELARLDLAAEELLQDVATGRVDLPLDRDLAATASALATDLRRTLVAGRRETWLHHAITESEYLSPAVKVSDPGGLAGYLEPAQRDGLLSAIWLIVDESGRSNPTIDLTVDGHGVRGRTTADDRMVLPIVMSLGGIPRRRIDPAVWSALSRVGQYSVDARAGRLRVSVDAHVVVPDASRAPGRKENW